jgi:uncharacterized protein YkwD
MVSQVIHWLTPYYTNNHRPKILQPAGLSVVVGLFLLVQTLIQLVEVSPWLPGGFVLGYASNISPTQIVEMTNSQRSSAGLSPLTVNEQLNQAALAKANHMFANDYWAHVAPDGTNPWFFIRNAGYAYSVAGENLARDFADAGSIVDAWMNSETHRANIVHQKYTEIGIAVVDGKLGGVETTLVVQMFGNPVVAAPSLPPATPEPVNSPVVETAPEPVAVIPEATPVALEIAQLEPVIEVDPDFTPLPTLSESALGIRKERTQPTLLISPLTITKAVGTALVVLLVLVLTYDSLVMTKKKLPRRVGNNWAHIGFLGMVLLIIVVIGGGRVL